MNDPFLKKLEEIRKETEGGGTQIFYGHLAEHSNVPTVHWNEEKGATGRNFWSVQKL